MSYELDYMDGDVAYLLGMLVARGELISADGLHRIVIRFPRGSLMARGIELTFDADTEIRLGIEKIRERIAELLGGDIQTVGTDESIDLIVQLTRSTIAWRDIRMLLDHKTNFAHFRIPDSFFEDTFPLDWKREFVKGYSDVAANLRPANRDQAGRYRVRLDTLNYPTNWETPVKLCLLLQDHLDVPVPSVIWGHPNLGREWREHQLNVYPEDFLKIGFYFDYKQKVLEELSENNLRRFTSSVSGCPGQRVVRITKERHDEEGNAQKMPPELVGEHFNSYWQICRKLGCTRRPQPREQLTLDIESNGHDEQ